MKVIGVRFKSTKKIYYFNPNGFEIKKNDNVIVETARGIEFGQTVIGIRDVPERSLCIYQYDFGFPQRILRQTASQATARRK